MNIDQAIRPVLDRLDEMENTLASKIDTLASLKKSFDDKRHLPRMLLIVICTGAVAVIATFAAARLL